MYYWNDICILVHMQKVYRKRSRNLCLPSLHKYVSVTNAAYMHERRGLQPLHHLRSPSPRRIKFWSSTKLPDRCTMSSWQMSLQPDKCVLHMKDSFEFCVYRTFHSLALEKCCRAIAEVVFNLPCSLRKWYCGDSIILENVVE